MKQCRHADQTGEDFDSRLAAMANALNKRRGKPVMIMLSPNDVYFDPPHSGA